MHHESALAPLTHTSPHSSCNIAHTSTTTLTKPKCSTAPVPPTPPPPLAIFDLSLQPRTLNPVFARHCQDVQPVATSSLRFLPQGGEARVHNARAQSSSPTRPHPSQIHLHHNIPTVPNSNISPTTRHVQVQLFAPSSPRFLLRGGEARDYAARAQTNSSTRPHTSLHLRPSLRNPALPPHLQNPTAFQALPASCSPSPAPCPLWRRGQNRRAV